MRTTILLDDELARQFRAKAREKGQSLSAFLAEAGRAALKAEEGPPAKPYKVLTYGKGGTVPGINLDKYSELISAEDVKKYRK